MGTKRKEREQQFRNPVGGAYGSFSTSLVVAAQTLLAAALHERKREVYRTAKDHFSNNAVGATALVVTAFDTWTIEALTSLAVHGVAEAREEALKPTVQKYASLARLTGAPAPFGLSADLALLVDVRDEVIHHLHRPLSDEGNVPPWLVELHRRGLFLSTDAALDFSLDQKLGSYRLAYWAFQTVESAVGTIAGGANAESRLVVSTASNFALYKSLCPPERLHAFDVEHGLSLTPKNPYPDAPA